MPMFDQIEQRPDWQALIQELESDIHRQRMDYYTKVEEHVSAFTVRDSPR